MAKQKGLLKIDGKIDKFRFYQARDGYSARLAEGINGQRILNDPSYVRTRENMQEFGRAQKYNKQLRDALKSLLFQVKDRSMLGRLTSVIMAGMKADMLSVRGLRNLTDGDIQTLTGFEFNEKAFLSGTFNGTYQAQFNRPTGELKIHIEDFVPTESVKAPQEATHFRFLSAGLSFDAEGGKHSVDVKRSAEFIRNDSDSGVVELVHQVDAGSTKPLILVFGIAFLIQSGNQFYPLHSGSYNALAIVGVNKP